MSVSRVITNSLDDSSIKKNVAVVIVSSSGEQASMFGETKHM